MILDTLAQASRKRVVKAKGTRPLEELIASIHDNGFIQSTHSREAFAFENSLKGELLSMICEVKKASPSKGVIAEEFPYQLIAGEYEAAGANAISVLTEPEYFKGSNAYLEEISSMVHVPVLRKDFTVDEYQIYEAKAIGADAVLLICTLLDTKTIKNYIHICDELGLSALVEAHTEAEIDSALQAGARVIGVNNRNLQTFEVDLGNSIRLRKLVPPEIIFVAESGISTPEDTKRLREAGVNAVLIGETLMRSEKKKEIIHALRGRNESSGGDHVINQDLRIVKAGGYFSGKSGET